MGEGGEEGEQEGEEGEELWGVVLHFVEAALVGAIPMSGEVAGGGTLLTPWICGEFSFFNLKLVFAGVIILVP